MGLITEELFIPISGSVAKYYENLGYYIPRREDRDGKLIVERGTQIKVNVKDLPSKSNARIDCVCDGEDCGKSMNMRWVDYLIVRKESGTYCFQCSHKLFVGINIRRAKLKNSISFFEWGNYNNAVYPLKYWDYEKTGFGPDEICFSSHADIYIKCPRGIHESEIKSIHNFVSGKWDIWCKQCNSLGQYFIDNDKTWGFDIWSDKNEFSPFDYDWSSGIRVWWKCPEGKHDDYERSIASSSNYDFHCKKCIEELKESILQNKVNTYLESIDDSFSVNTELNCEIVCINPKTKFNLPYDNEVIANSFKLIVEVHGMQHYEITGFSVWASKKNNTTPVGELQYQQWKDQIKKEYALSQGYYYLEIPYWADDENETYKRMIDDMIEFIYQDIKEN